MNGVVFILAALVAATAGVGLLLVIYYLCQEYGGPDPELDLDDEDWAW